MEHVVDRMKTGHAEDNMEFIKGVEKEVLLGSTRIPFLKSTSIDSWKDINSRLVCGMGSALGCLLRSWILDNLYTKMFPSSIIV